MREYTQDGPVSVVESSMPGNFPRLPDDVQKRFPSIAEYNKEAERFWRKARMAFSETNSEIERVITATGKTGQLSLKSVSDGFMAAITSEATARADADAAMASVIDTLLAGSGGNFIFVQASAPTALSAGDFWFDTSSSGFVPKYWDGDSWELARDSALTTAMANITNIQTTYATQTFAEAKKTEAITAAGIYTDGQVATRATLAQLTTEETARSDADSALASRASALEASVYTPSTGLLARVSTIETTYATDSEVSSSVSTAISAEVTNRNNAIKAAGADVWTPVMSGGMTNLGGGSFVRNGSPTAWDKQVYSSEYYTGGAQVSFRAHQTNLSFMAGLDPFPSENESYDKIAYAIYPSADGNLYIYEDGAPVASVGAYATSDRFSIIYDGAHVRYFKNGVLLRELAASAGQTLYLDSSFRDGAAQVDELRFGPADPAAFNAKALVSTEATTRASADSALASRASALEASVDTPSTGLLARVSTIESTYATDSEVSSSVSTAISAEVTNRNNAIKAAGADVWTPVVGSGMSDIGGGSFVKTDTAGLWDAQVYSSESYKGGARVSFYPNQTNAAIMVGLNSDPTTNASYDTIDYAMYCHDNGNLYAYENGSGSGDLATYATTDLLSVVYDGAHVRYYKNDTLLREVATTAGRTFYLDSSFAHTGSRVNKLRFGPVDPAAFNAKALVTTEASARATADGFLEGKYSIKVTAGNRVTGMNITSASGPGTDVSDISFIASSFKVYNNTTDIAPFQIVGSKIRFTGDVEIDGSLVIANTLSLTNLSNRSLANLDSTANTKLAGIATGADVTLSAINGGLSVTGGGITLSSGGAIKGGASSFSVGTGFFLGYEGGQYKFRVGNPSGPRIEWDGSTWTVNQLVPTGSIGDADIAGEDIDDSSYTAIVGLSATVNNDGYNRMITVSGNLEGDPSVTRTVYLKVMRDGSVDVGIPFSITVPANTFVYPTWVAVDNGAPAGSHTYAVYAYRPTSGVISASLTMSVL